MKLNKKVISTICSILFLSSFVFAVAAGALDLELSPSSAQREAGGKVRVHIYATDAVALISMGIKVTFDPSVLQVDDTLTAKSDGWVMDGDGDLGTTGDQHRTPNIEIDNTAGTVTMIGGRIMGSSTVGFTGKVLLGYITFDAVANGTSNLNVSLAQASSSFDHFVQLDGTVRDSELTLGNLGVICVVNNACTADINNNSLVDMGDFGLVRASMGKIFPDASYNVIADLNANGMVDMGDFGIVRAQMGTQGCPACSIVQ